MQTWQPNLIKTLNNAFKPKFSFNWQFYKVSYTRKFLEEVFISFTNFLVFGIWNSNLIIV